MKQISLTKGKFAIVDDEDYEFLMQRKWYFQSWGYAARREYIEVVDGTEKRRSVFMHREIIKSADGLYVDHINGNKIDNRKCNLRISTPSQNQMNKSGYKNSTSKYKGVSWKTANSRWVATISICKKKTHLGIFDSEEQAAICYNEAAKKHFGEFAILNVIDRSECQT